MKPYYAFPALFVAAALAACSSADPVEHIRIPAELNPTLQRLREPASVVLSSLGEGADTSRRIVTACLGADRDLEVLIRLDVQDEFRGLWIPTAPLATDAANMLRDRADECGELDTAQGLERCSRWCVSAWADLVLAVERLSVAGDRDGIRIQPLSRQH